MRKLTINETSDDSIIQIDDQYMTIIMFEKKDYHNVKELNSLTKTGIYILIGKEKVYVGQSSNQKGVTTRIKRHYRTKLWWHKAIIIIPKFIMTKAHYDYLEKTIIMNMNRHGNNLDNKTYGNTSPIVQEDQYQAELFLAHVLKTLSQIFHIDIYHLNQQYYIEHLERTVNQLIAGTLEDYE